MIALAKENDREKVTKPTILYFYLHCEDGRLIYNTFEYRFIEALCRDYRVIVAFFEPKGRRLVRQTTIPQSAEQLPIVEIRPPRGLPKAAQWCLEIVTRLPRLFLIMRDLRPTLIWGNWITRSSGFYCAMLGYHPFLAVAWGSDVLIEARRSPLLRIIGRVTTRTADAVIVDSEVQRKATLELGCAPGKICSFYWGIELDKFKRHDARTTREKLGWRADRIVISTRMHYPVYNIQCLIRAIPAILKKVENVMFVIAGDGPLLSYHKDLAKELSVEKHVKFIGLVQNELLPDLLNAADVYVSASLSDGASASLMEALACGLPVVVTRNEANMEWVNDAENGFLFSPSNSQELAERVIQILQDKDLRENMGQRNTKVARARADWRANSLVMEKCVAALQNRTQV
jgi:glycosyltransferase involved in cell wall biosynthesis